MSFVYLIQRWQRKLNVISLRKLYFAIVLERVTSVAKVYISSECFQKILCCLIYFLFYSNVKHLFKNLICPEIKVKYRQFYLSLFTEIFKKENWKSLFNLHSNIKLKFIYQICRCYKKRLNKGTKLTDYISFQLTKF